MAQPRGAVPGNQSPESTVQASQRLQHALYLAELYKWTDAGPDFRAAETQFSKAGDRRNALYAHLGLLRATIEQRNLPRTSAELATKLDTDALLRSDKQLRMFCFIVKGDIDQEIDSREARRDWEQVKTLAGDIGNERWQNRALAQIGIEAFYDRDLETASKNVATAVAVATKIHDVGAQIRYTTVLGKGLIEAKMYEQAMPYFANALALAKETPDIGYPFLTYEAQVEALIGLKRFDEAQQVIDELLKQSNSKYRTGPQAEILPIAAQIALARGKVQLAIDDLQRSIAICKAEGYQQVEAQPEAMLSAIFRERGDLRRAEYFAGEAAATGQASGDRWALPERLRTLAQLQALQGEYANADQTYQEASAFVDSGLANAPSVLEKTALIKASGDLFPEHFALVASHLRDSAKAYAVIEQVRGRVTTDLLMSGSATSQKAKAIERSIAALQLKMMTAKTVADVNKLRNEIFSTEELRWVAPDVSILKHTGQQIVPIESVEQTLDPSTAILEYVVAEPQSYCLVVTRAGHRIVPLAAGSQLDRLVDNYRKAVRAKLPAHAEARALYDALLKPISESVTKRDLVIVPDGQLHLLPFDALTTPENAYVLQSHVVDYVPSATVYYLLSREAKGTTFSARPLLAIGGIAYSRTTLHPVSLSSGPGTSAFADLSYSREEVLEANSALGGNNRLLMGQEATEAAFKRSLNQRFGTIHIAAHGLAEDPDPDNASLALLPDALAGEDGLLHASEIAMMHVDANLVVLSACDTAVGPMQGEEGISTLSNSFLLAGAKALVSTLWSADDSSSLFLMQNFYSRLATGTYPALALAEAKREMLSKFGSGALPYYWAGFKFEGLLQRTSSH